LFPLGLPHLSAHTVIRRLFQGLARENHRLSAPLSTTINRYAWQNQPGVIGWNQRRNHTMTIHLPPHIESSIQAAVHSGHFASVDDAMTEAASMLLQRLELKQAAAKPPATNQDKAIPAYKPIWEVVDELRKSVPPEEFAKLPKDGAEQLDHYLYGSPKRPTA
jgi:Arc/MetJ-type ribon-helix-helix transcriptional regulator